MMPRVEQIGPFRVVVVDGIPDGEVALVAGFGCYPLEHSPRHIVGTCYGGSVYGYEDAVAIRQLAEHYPDDDG
jgi:hypothetical protein